MKLEKIKYIIPIILGGILITMPQVHAKTSIEIKPNSSVVYTNQTISNFFDESLAMKDAGEGLESDNVDVHMAKNTEWAIVSYFSNSAYGTNGEGKNNGITISLDGKDYLSTNGNATGVLDFGKTATYTAGVLSNYEELENTSETEEPYDWGKSILDNATNSKYVDILIDNSNFKRSIAVTGWYGVMNLWSQNANLPYSVRLGLFDFWVGKSSAWLDHNSWQADGAATDTKTFRPIIWN